MKSAKLSSRKTKDLDDKTDKFSSDMFKSKSTKSLKLMQESVQSESEEDYE